MKHLIDSFYSNGKLHGHKGQDYAIHVDDYFIICDGCSSSEHSDVVARLQAHIAKKFIENFSFEEYELKDYELMVKFISISLKENFKRLGISGMPLATLVIGIVIDDIVRVIVIGDGVITYKNESEGEKVIEISYLNNAPFYPYYYNNKSLLEEYKNNFEEKYLAKVITFFDKEVVMDYDFINFDKPSIYDFPIKNLEYLYIFSDGISEITGSSKKYILDSIKDFTSMKNTNNGFIQRRCKRQLSEYEKEKIYPMDDFSMAGIFIK